MSARRALGTLLGVLAVLLAGCASHRSSHSGGVAAPHTARKTFHAYRPDGDLAVRVADVAPGRCWTASIAAPAADAYRCIAGDEILDPCYASAKSQTPLEVACIANPWSDAEVLQVSGALPKQRAPGTGGTRPWAFVLDNGVRCVAATGTVPAVHGVNLDYHCLNGRDAALLDTSGPAARADYTDAYARTVRRVGVATIWRA